MIKLFSALLFIFCVAPLSAGARIVVEGYHVADPDGSLLRQVRQLPELTIDHVHPGRGFEVHGPPGLGAWLQRVGARFQSSTESILTSRDVYPSPEEIEAQLQSLAASAPHIAKLFSIGRSVQGRNLWVMKISRNVQVDDDRPEFKFVANMHGDEIVGRELMVRLIADLIRNDGKEQGVTALLDSTQIYIMPSMNPDGAAARRRGNAQWVDLNRDFPDFTTGDNQNVMGNRAPETKAMMAWQASRRFRLSANFHGGAEVINYPWDTTRDPHPMLDFVKAISLEYARLASYIGSSTSFSQGIVNGYAWYEVNGGMQDWSYHWHRDLQVTVELSNQKWPPYSMVDRYYAQNRAALLTYIARVHSLAPERMTPRRPGRP